jgi:[acyl-carrier-protein] S-malonyltransferase
VPLVNNWQAREIRTAAEARQGLIEQVPNPVQWTGIVRYLAAQGVTRWIEAGPGSVLSGLLKSIIPGQVAEKLGEAADLAVRSR